MYSIDLKDNKQLIFPCFHSRSEIICDNNEDYVITVDEFDQIIVWEKETHLPFLVIKDFGSNLNIG